MLAETAKVIKIENQYIWVEAQSTGSCSSCSAQSACGHSLLSKLHPYRNRQLKVSGKDFTGGVGDMVKIGLDEGSVLTLSFSFYLLPLVLMLLVVSITSLFGFGELYLVLSALLSLIMGFCGLGMMIRKAKANPSYNAVLL